MMTPFFLAVLTAPLSWQQIEIHQKLILSDPIPLSEKLTLAPGTETSVTDILPLDEIRVLMFKMKITPCKGAMKTQQSEVVLVNELYGAKLEKNCTLEIFSEFTDLHKPSLFTSK